MLDKFKGCLLGLAVGDSLGTPVKFLGLEDIKSKYGGKGITDLDAWSKLKPGSYSDNTKIALATAEGCIRAYQILTHKGASNPAEVVYKRYLEWLKYLDEPKQVRYPEYTCVNALRSERMGKIEAPINESKGCGGVVRAAPAGLSFPSDMAFREGAEYAAITHGHPSAYLPAGFFSEMIAHIVEGKGILVSAELSKERLTEYDDYEETFRKIELALELSFSQKSIDESIKEIGEGWEGDEVLAIALYCSIKFKDDFKSGVVASVNNSGDSNSLGSITGALLGTLLGAESIPGNWIQQLENLKYISEMAEDINRIFKKGEALSFKKYPLE